LIKTTAFALLFILLFGCGRTGVVSVPFLEPKPYNIGKRNIIKFYNEEILFYDSCKIYLEEIDTSQISYYDRGIKLNRSKPKDYKIYADMIDWFDLEKTDQHKYKSPELFFTEEFNKNFIKGLRFGDDRYLKVEPIIYKDLESFDLEIIKKELPTNPKKIFDLLQPKQLSEFCKQFKSKYVDADFVVINNGMGITLGTFDGFTPSFLYTSKTRACAVLLPRTIIDLKQEKISAYFLEQNNIYYSSGLVTIKEGMIEEFEEVGKAFNSDF
jgi:hypothetical protein